mmetsp:Transcript_44461/g.112017  ORF Transcript_44461/g.112017 Transcript_44461/m.112017 type:complete len:302 (+) Transcript_44461:96-1001(+)
MADELSQALCQVVVGQALISEGAHGFSEVATDLLTDLLEKYMSKIAKRARWYADTAGRTQVNINDVELALQELNTSVADVASYYHASLPEPFPKLYPSFPIPRMKRRRRLLSSTTTAQEDRLPEHIPPWLPPFPKKRTYMPTELIEETNLTQAGDAEVVHEEKKLQRKAFLALESKLGERTVANYEAIRSGTYVAAAPQLQDAPTHVIYNPFLAPAGHVSLPSTDPTPLSRTTHEDLYRALKYCDDPLLARAAAERACQQAPSEYEDEKVKKNKQARLQRAQHILKASIVASQTGDVAGSK